MNSHCWHHKKCIENIADVSVWIMYLKKNYSRLIGWKRMRVQITNSAHAFKISSFLTFSLQFFCLKKIYSSLLTPNCTHPKSCYYLYGEFTQAFHWKLALPNHTRIQLPWQVFLSPPKVYPCLQTQVKDWYVLTQECSQPPLLVAHSSTSESEKWDGVRTTTTVIGIRGINGVMVIVLFLLTHECYSPWFTYF